MSLLLEDSYSALWIFGLQIRNKSDKEQDYCWFPRKIFSST